MGVITLTIPNFGFDSEKRCVLPHLFKLSKQCLFNTPFLGVGVLKRCVCFVSYPISPIFDEDCVVNVGLHRKRFLFPGYPFCRGKVIFLLRPRTIVFWARRKIRFSERSKRGDPRVKTPPVTSGEGTLSKFPTN
jgi:hypothetical protein